MTEVAPDALGWGEGDHHAPRRVAILVLGMHRSGTSVLTRILNLLGAALPRELLGGNTSNPKGHWEPQKLIVLHDAMLAEAGSRWDDWRPFSMDDLAHNRAEHYRAEIRRIIADEYGDAPLVVLKEPRISRFVPLYKEIFADTGFALRVVLTNRNPMAVIASLARRDGFSTGFASLVWLRHELDAEAATRGDRRATVAYEALLEDWEAVVGGIAARLGIEFPRSMDEARAEIEAYVSPEHRHHASSDAELARHPDIPDWVRMAHNALQRLDRDPDDPEAPAILDALRADFETASAPFATVFFTELRAREEKIAATLTQLRGELEKSNATASSLFDQSTLREGHIATLTHSLAAAQQVATESSATLARLVEDLEARSSLAHGLQASLAERDSEMRRKNEALAEADVRLNSLREQLEAAEAKRREQEDATTLLQAELDVVRGALEAARLTGLQAAAPGELPEQSGLSAEIGRLTADLERETGFREAAERALELKTRAYKERLLRLEEQLERQARERDRALGELARVEQSTAWRASGPLRNAAERFLSPGIRSSIRRALLGQPRAR